jgi:hypothetical protein
MQQQKLETQNMIFHIVEHLRLLKFFPTEHTYLYDITTVHLTYTEFIYREIFDY